MKKLVLAASIFASIASFGQNNVFPTPSGNVGIGTASPDAALHVWGGGREVLVGYSGTHNYNTRVAAASIFLNRPNSGNDPYAYSTIKQTGPGGIILDVEATNGSDVNLSGEGNLGIGQVWRPMAKLHVNGGILLEVHDKDNGYTSETYFGMFASDNADNVTPDAQKADVIIGWRDQAGSGNFWTNQGIGGMRIAPNGNVFIGNEKTTTVSFLDDWRTNYKLAVDGGVICESMKVQLPGDWADYVFEDSYELLSLEETKSFIAVNHHLPNVPSAQEIKADGIDTGEMLRIQMEKIEELTLHVIRLQEELNEFKK